MEDPKIRTLNYLSIPLPNSSDEETQEIDEHRWEDTDEHTQEDAHEDTNTNSASKWTVKTLQL